MKIVSVYNDNLSGKFEKELPDSLFDGDIIDIDFGGCQMIRIEKLGSKWVITDAMNGWGINNFDEFRNEYIDIIGVN